MRCPPTPSTHPPAARVLRSLHALDAARPDPFGGQRAGLSATAQSNRRPVGIDITVPMDGGGVVVGDKVSISLEVEVGRQLGPTDGSVEQAGGTRRADRPTRRGQARAEARLSSCGIIAAWPSG
jgi:hypothetical protein